MEFNASIDLILASFEEQVNQTPELSAEKMAELAGRIPSEAALKESLPAIKMKRDVYADMAQKCKDKVNMFRDSQKDWENKGAQLEGLLARCLQNVNAKVVKEGGITLATRERTALVVDDEWLTGLYQAAVDSLAAALPSYIKVKISVDKTELAKVLKNDESLLVDHPDKVYTQKTSSTTIK